MRLNLFLSTSCKFIKKLTPFISAFIFTLVIAYTLSLNTQLTNLKIASERLKTASAAANQELENLKNQDQYRINQTLITEIKSIHETYNQATAAYENILELKKDSQKTEELDKTYAQILKLLADKNYSSAAATLTQLQEQIKEQEKKLAANFKIPTVVSNNQPPASGYSRQQVQTESGNFMIDIASADLNSTKIVVDTAAESNCSNNCPVLSLGDYISRNNAFAGINGSYFCPAAYPSCVGKTNSFDTLLMNKNKQYFNSENNIYSTVPAVIFSGNSARFVSKSLEWGRDTSVDAVIANYPLLIINNEIIFQNSNDSKHNSKGPRNFIGTTNSTVYIGIIHNATLLEATKVLKTLGVANALNLDSGGSSALWHGGYKYGPGRNVPNAILLVER